MKKFFLLLLIVSISVGVYYFVKSPTEVKSTDESEINEIVEPVVQIDVTEHVVADDDTFTSVMESLGISYADALQIVAVAEEVFDFTSIKVGKPFRCVYEDGVQTRIEYEPGTEYKIVIDLLNGYETTKEDIEYELSEEWVEVTVENSLFVDGLEAGLDEVLLLSFVDVFAWEIDFATQVQNGDTYTILYEKRQRDGQDAGVGDVLYGSFTNMGETSYAYRFIDGDDTSYYSETGDSLVRAFLKAPLNFSRISSGYTNARFHPVMRTTTPHRAIDYAAPMGTPIKAVADGKVTTARWNGGYGNFIDIRHNSVYETQYAHLSKYAVKAGESVKQGQVIGYVGSTGFSTGPHLHYQVKVNGTLTNPLEVEFPKGDPITDDRRDEFNRQKAEIDLKVPQKR